MDGDEQIVLVVNLTGLNKPDYEDSHIIEHKNSLELWLAEVQAEKKTSYVLSLADILEIKDVIKGA